MTKQQRENSFAVLVLNINRFKAINNCFGYKIGDQLLIALSRKLENCLRSEDTISRLGSDEFAILLEKIRDLNCAIAIAERIQQELMLPQGTSGFGNSVLFG